MISVAPVGVSHPTALSKVHPKRHPLKSSVTAVAESLNAPSGGWPKGVCWPGVVMVVVVLLLLLLM